MDSRRALDSQAYGLMVVFCLLLGFQQVALKAIADDIAPVLQIALRSGVGAILLALLMLLKKERWSFADNNWKPGILIGILFSLEYVFVGEALRYTTAGHTVVFLYTSPVVAALGLHFLVASERMTALQWVGITLAFAGIFVAFIGDTPDTQHAPNVVLGDIYALLSGVAWGLTTVVIRTTSLAKLSASQTLMYQLVAAFILLLLAAYSMDQFYFNPTPTALAGLGFQAIGVSFIAFLIWFWLIRHYQASRIGVLSFMTPILGVLMGAWLLDEALDIAFLVGSVLVIVGLILVTGHAWIKQRVQARQLAD